MATDLSIMALEDSYVRVPLVQGPKGTILVLLPIHIVEYCILPHDERHLLQFQKSVFRS